VSCNSLTSLRRAVTDEEVLGVKLGLVGLLLYLSPYIPDVRQVELLAEGVVPYYLG
jgi:hypothetical protein